jgi:hypothetical protein
MALDEIRALLALQAAPNESCEAVNNVLDEHIEHVAQRIRELTALKKQLVALRGQCAQAKDVAHCGILSGLGQGETLEQQTARQHVSASHGKRR